MTNADLNADLKFDVGVEVECKHGIGRVTYCEDGYMDIELRDGTERNFFAPFKGKVWHYVKPVPLKDLDVWHHILQHPAVTPHLDKVRDCQREATMIVRLIGGQGGKWNELSDYQKVNFLSVYSGCTAEQWKEVYENGTLTEFAQSRLVDNTE